ncbi:MAG: PilN domain-containing protein, partial [Terriglobia bacterium]
LSGLLEIPDKASSEFLNLRCHALAQPLSFGLGTGDLVITSREMQDHFSSLAAGVSVLRKRVPEPVNLLPADKRARVSTWQVVPAYTLLAVNCLLLLALLVRGRLQQSIFSSQLGQEISRIEPEVKKVRGVENALAQLMQRTNVLAEFKGKNAQVLAALVELSEILPTDTFVADLILKEGVFEINGLSGQAASLPQIIDNSSLFRDVEFVAAITRSAVAPDKEGYRIRMKLETPTKVPGSAPIVGPTTHSKSDPLRPRTP